ncbi:hypothetical protein [Peribacillus simplex]|nr:hypothetical protein [Peribacillus simplex]
MSRSEGRALELDNCEVLLPVDSLQQRLARNRTATIYQTNVR